MNDNHMVNSIDSKGRRLLMAKDVLCEVSNCVHNLDGEKCTADQIFVVSHVGNKARKSEETDCQTFEPGR
jgi:Domain of Unknown Function (DUF1540)